MKIRRGLAIVCLAAAALAARASAWQQDHQDQPLSQVPLPEKSGPLRKALLLLRDSKTAEARKELEEQRKQRPDDAERARASAARQGLPASGQDASRRGAPEAWIANREIGTSSVEEALSPANS